MGHKPQRDTHCCNILVLSIRVALAKVTFMLDMRPEAGSRVVPPSAPHTVCLWEPEGEPGTNLCRTWHQLQLKVRSEDMQASQLRCCRQAAKKKAAVTQHQSRHRPPKGATSLNAGSLQNSGGSDQQGP